MERESLRSGEDYLHRIAKVYPLPAGSEIGKVIFRETPDYHDDSIYSVQLAGKDGKTLWSYEQHGDYEIIWPVAEYLGFRYSCPITKETDY